MRIVLLISLFPLSLLACPELSGTYLCGSSADTYEVNIEQKLDGKTSIYYFSLRGRHPTYIADGADHTFFTSETRDLYVRSKCRDDSLNTIVSGKMLKYDIWWDLTSEMNYYIVGNKLHISGKKRMVSTEGGIFQQPIEDTCLRLQE